MHIGLLLRIGFLGLAAAAVLGLASSRAAYSKEYLTYAVTVENLTTGQPFTPPVVAAHGSQLDLFEIGEPASEEVQQIAENGNNDPLVTLLDGSDAVADFAVGDGPIMPGESATLSIEAPAESLLSLVFMLICTNDGFSGVDSLTLPASGSETVDRNAYDAGTEENSEDFADIVPPCQGLIGVSSDDEGTGASNPELAEGGVIASHPGIQGGNDLTVGDHGWTDPVVRITVSAEAPPAAAAPPAAVPPVTGSGGLLGDGDGGLATWLYVLVAAGLVFLMGALAGLWKAAGGNRR